MTKHFAYPPFRMKADHAAYYCGMSLTQFLAAVERGEYPKGQKRPGGRYWLRHELEMAMVNTDGTTHNFGDPI